MPKNKSIMYHTNQIRSKTIKNKNIKKFKGKPLSYFNIKTASVSGIFEKILIATDSYKFLIF